ncbi:MAG: pilus assembly protein [Actinobacteria bacterium]|nr:pilus assembly protein [Actinomycetota bacterium]
MHRPLGADERGSVTIWLALASFVMVVLVGLAVDLSGQVYAQQHAHDVAASAARTAGQQIDAASGVRGLSAAASPAEAVAAARTYVSASGMVGDATITAGGTTVTVTAQATYTTRFLGVIGIDRLVVTARAEVRVVRVVGGVER